MQKSREGDAPFLIGWREWAALPDLGLGLVKAKIDTGARTSTLHAFSVETFHADGRLCVRFGVHPLQKRTDVAVYGEAPVIDQRLVTDSGGHCEERYVIETRLVFAGCDWPIELTLTNREVMLFRMLLGRTALAWRMLVDPSTSFVTGRVSRPSRYYLDGPAAGG